MQAADSGERLGIPISGNLRKPLRLYNIGNINPEGLMHVAHAA